MNSTRKAGTWVIFFTLLLSIATVEAQQGSRGGLSPTPYWTYESNSAESSFGWSTAKADVNGDRISDLIVGSQLFKGDQYNEGKVNVFYGTTSGLRATPDLTLEGELEGVRFGWSVAGAGDVNKDGFEDVLVGAVGFKNGNGAVFLFYGSASGLSRTPAWIKVYDVPRGAFGWTVKGGDINGDGYSDILVSAPYFHKNNVLDLGAVYAFHGNSTVPSQTPSWAKEGTIAKTRFGQSMDFVGDINRDGYGDIIIGQQQGSTNLAEVYYGNAVGLANLPAWKSSFYTPTVSPNNGKGISVSSAGDINKDGFADILIGAVNYSETGWNGPAALIYNGSLTGLPVHPSQKLHTPSSTEKLILANAGDLNRDGFADIVVSSDVNQGVYAFYGSVAGVSLVPNWISLPYQTANWNLMPPETGEKYGYSISAAGDINNDGIGDLVVGAPSYKNSEIGEGKVYLFKGNAASRQAYRPQQQTQQPQIPQQTQQLQQQTQQQMQQQ